MQVDNIEFDKIFKIIGTSGDDYIDIFFESNISNFLSNENKKLEKAISGVSGGAGLRLISEKKSYYAFTNNIDEKNLLEIGKNLNKIAKTNRKNNNFNKLDLNFKESKAKIDIPILKDALNVSMNEKIKKIDDAVKFSWGYDKRILQANVLYKDYKQDVIIVNSKGNIAKDSREIITFFVNVVASNGKKTEMGYEPASAFMGFEFFETVEPAEIARKACSRAITLLDAPFAPSGTMPVVLSSEAGGTMIHEAIGHGLEADITGSGLSVYSDKIGQEVASKLVTVIDDSSLIGKRGSYRFDDEGTASNKNILVENGVLKKYMSDRLSNIKYGYELTGNGRRESYEHQPIVRMSNTMIAKGKSLPEDIIKTVDKGLFVKKMGGGQVNTVTGDFVFEVMEGYILKNGVVCEAVSGATLMGNGPEILNNIDMIGNDMGYSVGTCGKDGQGAPVSDGQPTLRIPSIVVGGKNQE